MQQISAEMRQRLEQTIELINNYKQLEAQLHWLKIAEDGAVELFLDNHMMQTFRACESHFVLDFVEGWQSKSGHIWFLDFGICIHTMIEYYYIHRKDPDFDVMHWAGTQAFELWDSMKMDDLYNEKSSWHHRNYNILGGVTGFSALLWQYAQAYQLENERLRVIGSELYFGKGREVPLGESYVYSSLGTRTPFRLFLCGKIDLLVDDGFNIGPVDHKTVGNFWGKNPIASYEVHEGMTGYVFATKKLLEHMQTGSIDYTTLDNRTTNKVLMNFMQVTPLPEKRRDGTKPHASDRFKRVPIFYTDYQLEQYRCRQLSTASRILQILLEPLLVPTRNTMICNNYMHNECKYRGVHRQNSKESELIQLNSDFVKGKIWNPEDRDANKIEGGE